MKWVHICSIEEVLLDATFWKKNVLDFLRSEKLFIYNEYVVVS